MRLLHVVPSLDPTTGGPLAGALAMSRGLSSIGHRADLVGLVLPGESEVAITDVTVHAIHGVRGRWGYGPRLTPWLTANVAAYDAVIIHGLWRHYGWAASWVARRLGIPYFVWPHGSLEPYALRYSTTKFVKKMVYWAAFESRVCAGARAVLFTTDEELEVSRRVLTDRAVAVVVTPAGASPDPDPAGRVCDFVGAFPGLRGRDLVLFLGRLDLKKRVDVLIQAFAEVAREFPCADLVVAGPDRIGWRPELEALASRLGIAERVVFTGMLDVPLKWGAFAASRVFVLPSHQENFAFAAVEALCAGLPVIISRRVNIWREVEEAHAGLVVDPTPASTADALRRALGWPERLEVMAANARALGARRYEAGQVARQFVACLERLIDHR